MSDPRTVNQEGTMRFERSVEAQPAWDRRDPNPSKNYGVHGVEFLFKVANVDEPTTYVLFRVSSSWMLPEVYDWWRTIRQVREEYQAMSGQVVATHWLTEPPTAEPSEDRYETKRECSDNPGRWCDGGAHYLLGDEWGDVLLRGGTKELWPVMEAFLQETLSERLALVTDGQKSR